LAGFFVLGPFFLKEASLAAKLILNLENYFYVQMIEMNL
jgi:hypothetical protein